MGCTDIVKVCMRVSLTSSIKDHLIERHVDFHVHRFIYISEEERIATFLLTNGCGTISGFQQYRPDSDKTRHNDPRDGRYFTYRMKSNMSFFGYESMRYREDILFVTEGIFDAVRLTKYRQPAIALLSNDPSQDVRNYLSCVSRKIIAVCDSGKPGEKLKKVGDEVITLDEGDLGDASEEFVRSIVEHYK